MALDRVANLLGTLSLVITDSTMDAIGEHAERSPSDAAALSAMLNFLPRPSVDRLRQVLGLTPSGTVRLVDRLEAAGLVRRGAGADGRSTSVVLTAAGRRAAHRVGEARAAVLEASLQVLSDSERGQLDALLAKVLVGRMRGPGAVRWMCRLCDMQACGRDHGRCPVAQAAADTRVRSRHRGADRLQPRGSHPTRVAAVDTPVVGVVGAGQLARMMQQAAIGLGVPLSLLAESGDAAAAQVVPATTVGDYRDLDTLRAWAADCTVVTFDHEHVPTGHLDELMAAGRVCRPTPGALVHAQDKAVMRARLRQLDLPCPLNAVVESGADIDAFARAGRGYPVVVKATRGGYDGRGVWFVDTATAAEALVTREAAGMPLLVEERVDFVRELSAVVARSPSGQLAAYPVVQSVQRDGICVEVVAPAPGLAPELAIRAQSVAMRIAAELDVAGILAVELFETRDGRILVNELAMRPHNTGHWSIDAAQTSQFENHLRAVLDLPLGSPAARARWSVMVNILGGSAPTLYDGYPHVLARDPAMRVHLYGKSVRPGRKVGHVTAYGDDLDDLLERARHAAAWFEGSVDDDSTAEEV